MLSKTFSRSVICSFLVCLTFVGCGGEPKPDGFPKVYPVTLTFTQEGDPCVEAKVTLVPESDSPWGTGGITDANGKVALHTHGKFLGVPAGKYKIVVSKTEMGTAGPQGDMFSTQIVQTFNLIDPQYANSASSTLTIEVEENAKKKTYPAFELGAKVREPVKAPGM